MSEPGRIRELEHQLHGAHAAYKDLEEQLETSQFECESLRHKLDDAYHMEPGSMARHWEEESKRLRTMLDAVLPDKTTFHVIDGPMPGHHIPIQLVEEQGSNPASVLNDESRPEGRPS